MIDADRGQWFAWLDRMATTPLTAQADGSIHDAIAGRADSRVNPDRLCYANLEAISTLLAGIAPWLEYGGGSNLEIQTRDRLRSLARDALRVGLDPSSPARFDWDSGEQALVNLSCLSLALLRSPNELLGQMDGSTTDALVRAIHTCRRYVPYYNNHLLFAALNEALLAVMGLEHDPVRVDHAIRSMEQWYLGDSVYGDGPDFHWNYYQSIVIHPWMLTLRDVFRDRDASPHGCWQPIFDQYRSRARRAAYQQAMHVAPDGTFPVIGRSITYRSGVFHHLADTALRQDLPPQLTPAATRVVLGSVIRRTLEAPGTFDDQGWLTMGLAGRQPGLAEPYITTGTLYCASMVFAPLGLPPEAAFWSDPTQPHPWQVVWRGEDFKGDLSLERDKDIYR